MKSEELRYALLGNAFHQMDGVRRAHAVEKIRSEKSGMSASILPSGALGRELSGIGIWCEWAA